MTRHLKIFGILGILGALALTPSALADGGGSSFAFRPGGGGGGGARQAAPAAQPSNQQQFFNQAQARQQQFFAQPVFPHSGFQQGQGIGQNLVGFPGSSPSGAFQGAFVPPPILIQQNWISPPVNNYLPPQFYYGVQPGFYVAPMQFNNGTTVLTPATVVYPQQQPVNSFVGNSAPQMTPGLIGRW